MSYLLAGMDEKLNTEVNSYQYYMIFQCVYKGVDYMYIYAVTGKRHRRLMLHTVNTLIIQAMEIDSH